MLKEGAGAGLGDIDRLEAKGFVRREFTIDDRRVKQVRLTPKGLRAAGTSNVVRPIVDDLVMRGLSPLARRMVKTNSLARNYALIGITVLAGLIGVAFRWTYWGVIFMVPLGGSMMALGYMVSYYLNAIVDSSHRATVLSFKGVAFNLGYGFISLVFALVLRAVREGGSTQEAVARSLVFLPVWIVFAGLICAISFRSHRGELMAKV